MRDDMFEVIIEKPRFESRARYSRGLRRRDAVELRRDPESLAFAAPMKTRRASKSLNENLSPLSRYLERQVNRPWNKVWSEISAKLKPDSTVQQHVRDHVGDFVAIRTSFKDGAVWVGEPGVFGNRPLKLTESRTRLYVDPRSGLLRRNKHAKTWKQRLAAQYFERHRRMREIAPNLQAHRFDGRGWWEVMLAPTNLYPYVIVRLGIDVVLSAGFSTLMPDVLYGRRGVYAIAKRQMSKREIARLLR
jgi:hypothetical protein